MTFDRLTRAYACFARWCDHGAAGIVILAMLSFTCVVLLQIFMRYVVGSALRWPEEFACFSLVWMIFVGASCALRRGLHVGVDYFVEMVGSIRIYAVLRLLSLALMGILVWFMITQGLDLAQRGLRRSSPTLGITYAWMHAGYVIGAIFMAIQLLDHALTALKAFLDPAKAAESGGLRELTSEDIG